MVVWPVVLAAAAATFLLPGLLGAAALERRGVVPATAVPLTAVALSSVLGYGAFWAYLASPGLGRAASIGVTMAGVAVPAAWPPARRLLVRTVRSRAVGLPLALMFLVTLTYHALLFAHGSQTPVELRARTHLMSNSGLPVDNALPQIYADRLYRGEDPRAPVFDWLSSDRPPLQTGAVLLQRPFASVLALEALHYQLLASVLQASWVAAVWAVCAAARFRVAATAVALATATFSGFFLVNSLFVWPKLYAGALALLPFALLIGARPAPATAAVAAGGAALGLLAHGGVMFVLVPMAVIVLARRTRPRGVPAVTGVAVAAALLAPWWGWYVPVHDPPGNRLAKWHLAGVIDVDDRSLGEALSDAYTGTEPGEIWHNKWRNLDTLVDAPPTPAELRELGAERVRSGEFFVTSWAFGPLNLAWLALGVGLVRFRRTWPVSHWRGAVLVLGLGVAATVFWALAMYGPATTVIHQGSYATMILLWVGLAGVAAHWPRLGAALAAAQVVYFGAVWGLDMPDTPGPLAVPDAVLAAVAATTVLAVLWRAGTAPTPVGDGDRTGGPGEPAGARADVAVPAAAPA